ncbi:right-handed parallel beta-helix repeat-containing protein [Methanobrevibacter sp.]
MNYGKTIILLVLAIFLFSSLTGVFANEMDAHVASDDSGQLELSLNEKVTGDNLQTSGENNTLTVAENELTVDQITYSDLKEQIKSGGNINLNKGTYTYKNGDGDTIQITKSGIINGNGAVIDMNKSGHRAFDVTASDVTIKNLTIKNAKYNSFGGAIYFKQSGTVTNCNFTDNTANSDGGAVYFWVEGTVTNCKFTDNTATGAGGAVHFSWFNKGTVTNCTFTDNTAINDGGAIWMNSGNVENCNFTGNKATDTYSDGGAIWMASGNVKNCNFNNNSAPSWGGAIQIMNTGTVTNCNFTDNSASRGGAIICQQLGAVTADKCIFKTDSDTTFNTHNL